MLLRTIAVVGLVTACVHTPHDDHPQDSEPHWAYEGREGPATWGELNPAFRRCATGRHQSPIDLDVSHTEHAKLPRLTVHYGAAKLVEVDNGHTIQDTCEVTDRYVQLGSTRYELAQFHFHHPSEHTLDGVHYPLEIHMVHRNADDGRLLVLGILVEEGAESSALGKLFDQLPAGHEHVPTSVDPSALLPVDPHYVTYEGSLTTPPCTEGVTWIVYSTPIGATPAQIEKFSKRYPHNNRPVMPRGDRRVLAND